MNCSSRSAARADLRAARTTHEPHSGKSIQLGTTQVANYAAPVHLYDKVLLVEKVGLLPVLLAARLGERYDLAIMATNGYSPEAARVLAAQLHGRGFLVFTLHDARLQATHRH